MIDKLDYKRCTICQACINICPKDCISLSYRKDDFDYPTIDKKQCINCKLCEKSCPVLNPLEKNKPLKEIYAGINLDEHIRLNSSSGGIFTSLAKIILKYDGYISGAIFDDNFQVKHIITNNEEELKKLRGSKYVQSNTYNIYKSIKEKLKENKKVLFTGCPCQVGGLKKYLGKDYENLYTIDFICHGITSQNTFNGYKSLLEQRYKSKIVEFLFREKSKGWHTSSVKVSFDNGKIYTKPITEDEYMRGFLNNLYSKPACHDCDFRNFKSTSDITLADYWGAEVEEKEIDDNKGLSIILVNSQKGKELKDKIKSDIYLKNIDFDRAIKYNQSLIKSSRQSEFRDKFFILSDKDGYEKAFIKLCREKVYKKIVREVHLALGRIKRFIISKI